MELPIAYQNIGSIEDITKRIIGDHFGIPGATLTLDTAIKEDLVADYTDLMELIMTIEELFEIRIPQTDIAQIQTISDVVNVLKKYSPI